MKIKINYFLLINKIWKFTIYFTFVLITNYLGSTTLVVKTRFLATFFSYTPIALKLLLIASKHLFSNYLLLLLPSTFIFITIFSASTDSSFPVTFPNHISLFIFILTIIQVTPTLFHTQTFLNLFAATLLTIVDKPMHFHIYYIRYSYYPFIHYLKH